MIQSVFKNWKQKFQVYYLQVKIHQTIFYLKLLFCRSYESFSLFSEQRFLLSFSFIISELYSLKIFRKHRIYENRNSSIGRVIIYVETKL